VKSAVLDERSKRKLKKIKDLVANKNSEISQEKIPLYLFKCDPF